MRSSRFAALAALGIVAFAAEAGAVITPPALAGRPALEVASGAPVRNQRTLDWQHAPRRAGRAWSRLVAEVGPGWRAGWDPDTGVPSRLYGPGVHVPGAVASDKAAATFARAFLARHADLLAPGAAATDFVIVANDLEGGMRTVGLRQRKDGMAVAGGQVSFRFKADQLTMIGSEALPFVDALPAAPIADGLARSIAEQWILADSATTAHAGDVSAPMVLPLVSAGGARYRTVIEVKVEAQAPLGRWSVYLDAASGAPVAREQTLRFATGTVLYNAPVRWPGSDRADYPAVLADELIGGVITSADANGILTFADGAPVTVDAQATGALVRVLNDAGAEATQQLTLDPGGTAVWNAAADATVDAQLASYIHAHEAKAYTKLIAPSMAFLGQKLTSTVNINDVCNAFSDGTDINFYKSGNGCENTGRLADVVYHEFGHSFHFHAIIAGVGAFEGALSEGQADYLAATMTGDPGMGRGFFFDNQPLRQIDPPNGEHVWPDDVAQDPHETGLIIGGALWDLRKALVAKLGEAQGVATTDQLYYQAIRRAVDIPTMYPEVLAADDDDGDLTNGTPNACEISEAFAAHGLRMISIATPDFSTTLPEADGFHVSVKIAGLFSQCQSGAIGSAKLAWRLREAPQTGATIDMTGTGEQFEAVIPTQPDGTVVQYQVLLKLSDGTSLTYPENEADPRYEFFVGKVEPIYCTDFESNPDNEGWTHGLSSGQASEGADDWQWGTPAGTAGSGDPALAYSGLRVFGNDLGKGNFNGNYQSDKVNFAQSPEIDVSAFSNVRLQYRRWLNVEDGFFDHANIYANDALVWTNANSNQGDSSNTHHQDKEWRFQDVDLTPHVAGGKVKVKYEIASDGGLELGGWTLDDFCVVGFVPPAPPVPVCGDGLVGDGEGCDDGADNSDTAPDACRTDCQPAGCGDGVVDAGEACDDNNLADGDGCTPACQVGSTTPAPTSDDPPEAEGGCGCRTAGGPPGSASAALAGAPRALAWARRRRRPR